MKVTDHISIIVEAAALGGFLDVKRTVRRAAAQRHSVEGERILRYRRWVPQLWALS
jgi:hypothetical protein